MPRNDSTRIPLDKLNVYRHQLSTVLKESNIEEDTPFLIEFGLKEGRGAHHSVILIHGSYYVFQLDLILEYEQNECSQYIVGEFRCPKHDCNIENSHTKSFIEYTSHYLHHFRHDDIIEHECCGEKYKEFIPYCKHLQEEHKSSNPNGINFKQIHVGNVKEIKDDPKISFFPSSVKHIAFRTLHENALLILQNFGNYFMFFWNCQDYATWFLTFHGIPLYEIRPTLTDRSSGSNTESSARIIQRAKKKWYEDEAMILIENSDSSKVQEPLVRCNEDQCKYFPPMKIKDLKTHENVAHVYRNREHCIQIRRKLVGNNYNDHDSTTLRKFSLYRLQKAELLAHDSLVIQPWSLASEPIQLNHFCRIHAVRNTQDSKQRSSVKYEVIHGRENYLHHLFDFEMTLEVLHSLCMEESHIDDGTGGTGPLVGLKHCRFFCSYLIEKICNGSNTVIGWETNYLDSYNESGEQCKSCLKDTINNIKRSAVNTQSLLPKPVNDPPTKFWRDFFQQTTAGLYGFLMINITLALLVSRIAAAFDSILMYLFGAMVLYNVYCNLQSIWVSVSSNFLHMSLKDFLENFLSLFCMLALLFNFYRAYNENSHIPAALNIYLLMQLVVSCTGGVTFCYNSIVSASNHAFVPYKVDIRHIFVEILDNLELVSFLMDHYKFIFFQIFIGILRISNYKLHASQMLFNLFRLIFGFIGLFNGTREVLFDEQSGIILIPFVLMNVYHMHYMDCEKRFSVHEADIIAMLDTMKRHGTSEISLGSTVAQRDDIKRNLRLLMITRYVTWLRYVTIIITLMVTAFLDTSYVLMSLFILASLYSSVCQLHLRLTASFKQDYIVTPVGGAEENPEWRKIFRISVH